MTFSTARDLNIICIDPSLRSTGVFICEKGECRAYSIQKKDERKTMLGMYIKHFAKEAKKKYDLCVIEGYSMGSRGSAVTSQAEVGGIIRACFIANGTPVIEIAPMTWKSITGLLKLKLRKNSVSEKREYLNHCDRVFGFTFDNPDECDAFYMFWSLVQISRGNFKKGVGSKIRYELEEYKIAL